ncbi:MAG: hypothetical protein EXS30_01510 [Pedosphaera sp.]|nr:hypothetical protein [Pedosphaera sp.]
MKSVRLILLLTCLLPIRLVAGEQPTATELKVGVDLVPKITVYGPSGTAARVEWSTSLGNGVLSEWHLLKKVTLGTA